MKRLIAICCLVTGLCTACQTDTLYHRYRSTGPYGWDSSDTLEFRLPSALCKNRYRLDIGIRHTECYPYRDLWISILHPARPQAVDTLHIWLADSAGHWLGHGLSGSSCQYVSGKHSLVLAANDSVLRIVHLMSRKHLPGLTDVGLRLSAFPPRVDSQKDKQQDGETP